jgi:Family of unknown function (DUF6052)
MNEYEVVTLTDEERDRLHLVYYGLKGLSSSGVPAVRAAARAALSHIAQALNGEGLEFELYTKEWEE